tara:strand:+ start:2083 stop:4617 length:2535 start_codon:yes stop_codon:yes gene_type:complete
LAIEQALTERPLSARDVMSPEEVEIEILNPEAVSIETEDGGMTIDFRPETEQVEDFGANLSEFMEEDVLSGLCSELVGHYLSDKTSRRDWEESYIKGLNQLGLKVEERTSPWDGACGVTHPILSEAVVRFQSQAIGEIFPPGGPVRTKIVGKMTSAKTKQSHRVENYMNYLVTEVMTEYRPETEKLLFSLPLAGSAFRKIYWDPSMGRPCAMFVPSEDLVVSYGASSLETCERLTHRMRRNRNDVRKMQVDGFYRDVELGDPTPDSSEIQEKYDDLTGEHDTYEFDGRYLLLEMHVDLDLEGFEDQKDGKDTGVALPYVVTVELGSRKVLSIRRNWQEGDPRRLRRDHFVHYEYVPGLGFYGFGLIHMIGGLAKSATSILRQLVDAGTLSNLPGGLKARGLRIRGDDTPISPGEFRDVDVPSGAIRDNITFLPYKEPSGVLYQLLGNIVEEGRRFASLTDLQISDMNQQAPVGTTLALLERSMKVMAAVQARLHASMKREFGILAEIVRDNAPHEYPYDLSGDEEMRLEDFDDRIDVLPVSDPNSATMAQRIMQYQAALQLAGTSPEMYDMPQLHRQMLEVLGINDPDKIIPLKDEIPPRDPAAENMDLLNGKPVRAFLWQDQEAHIIAHMAAAQDPKIQELVMQSPSAGSIQSSLAAHVTEHVAFQYRKEIQKQLGVELPNPEDPLPEDVEYQLSRLVAEAAERVLKGNQAERAQQQAQEQAEDPIIQMRQKELEIREQEAQARIANQVARLVLDSQKAKDRGDLERERIASQERQTGAKIGAELTSDLMDMEMEGREIASREGTESSRAAAKMTETLVKGAVDAASRADERVLDEALKKEEE